MMVSGSPSKVGEATQQQASTNTASKRMGLKFALNRKKVHTMIRSSGFDPERPLQYNESCVGAAGMPSELQNDLTPEEQKIMLGLAKAQSVENSELPAL